MNSDYWIANGEAQKGPYTLSQIRSMWQSGAITADLKYWTAGMDAWESIAALMTAADPHRANTPPIASPKTIQAASQQAASKRTAQKFDLAVYFLYAPFIGISRIVFKNHPTDAELRVVGLFAIGSMISGVVCINLESERWKRHGKILLSIWGLLLAIIFLTRGN